jgi:Flp pilus assembly protein protease CpaA
VVVGLTGHTLLGGLAGDDSAALGLTGSLLGLAVGFGPLLIAWLAGGINGGDAKLMGSVGALTGWSFALSAMFYGFAVAAVMSLIVMLRRGVLIATLKRIGRFLYLSMSPNRPSDPTTPESPKIPFGLALCIGSAIACVEFVLQGRDAFAWPLGG